MKSNTIKLERLNRLMELAVERYSFEEITTALMDATMGWKDREAITKTLLSDNDFKDDLKVDLEADIIADRIVIQNIPELDKRDKLNQFLTTQIFPYYNEHGNISNLLFN